MKSKKVDASETDKERFFSLLNKAAQILFAVKGTNKGL